MPAGPRHNHSFRSTWRRQDRNQWTTFHWILEWGDLHPTELGRTLCTYWLGMKFHPVITFVYYNVAFQVFLSLLLRSIRQLRHTYGFLDGDKLERDGIPDVAVRKAFMSILLVSIGRPLMTVPLAYRVDETPSLISWKFLPLEAIMHEVDCLWRYHRTYHLNKHPNPLLAIYADHKQEFFDIWGIPLMTYFTMRLKGLPMGYYEWYICQQYVVFSEVAGHSGLRLYAPTPNLASWVMKLFDVDEAIEDHDLHHRRGWKHSFNYGKQTRI
ncbi:hypothetical protein BDV33DRAFT_196850 [Aspergillus novoparasiticus]|uniref:Fatty acid hydroxylase domain-containing protein n=1 Tax=Aspergillus novoparasiticus TaxID=986946 RepID=A0A5N6E850_9EURO|nr:hypothetical protein BDV33DRAFT_196850 [Aspergillus novoparasiticus]